MHLDHAMCGARLWLVIMEVVQRAAWGQWQLVQCARYTVKRTVLY